VIPVCLDSLPRPGFLFYYHLHSRPPLDAHVHTLLLVPVFAGAACAMLQAFLRDNILLELLLGCLFFLQGSWFYQVGLPDAHPTAHPTVVDRTGHGPYTLVMWTLPLVMSL